MKDFREKASGNHYILLLGDIVWAGKDPFTKYSGR
jgi:hypothetical protein